MGALDLLDEKDGALARSALAVSFHFCNIAQCLSISRKSGGPVVNTTPVEAGWIGRLVVELRNLGALPLRVYINEGSARYCSLNHTKTAARLMKIAAGNTRARRD